MRAALSLEKVVRHFVEMRCPSDLKRTWDTENGAAGTKHRSSRAPGTIAVLAAAPLTKLSACTEPSSGDGPPLHTTVSWLQKVSSRKIQLYPTYPLLTTQNA